MAKRWTKQEDEILVKLIEKGKLPNAISEVSTSLGRSEDAIYQRYLTLKNKNKFKPHGKLYTKEEEQLILDYIANPKNTNLQELTKRLGRDRHSVSSKIYLLRKKHPEIRRFSKAKISIEDLKQVMEEEIASNKHNLHQAFRNISDRTGLSADTIESYWYKKKGYRIQLNRSNMPPLFYTSDSKGASKNEKNTNVIQVSKGKYLFNMITSWLNNKFKVKSTTKKNSK